MVEEALGISGIICSLVTALAPIEIFWKILLNNSAENYSGIPYITSLFSCCLWILYGVLNHRTSVIIANGVCGVLQFIYLCILLIYYPRDKKVTYAISILLGSVLYGILLAVTLVGVRYTFLGVLCVIFSIIAYAAPLITVITTMKTKSVEHMPFLPILTFFIKGCVWFAYALIVKDNYVLAPNAAGMVLGAIQLSVYFIYKNLNPAPTEDAEV